MEINELKKSENKKIAISIRMPLSYSLWLKQKDISPTLLFNKCVEELMAKDQLNTEEN